jgi:hypothetical protein
MLPVRSDFHEPPTRSSDPLDRRCPAGRGLLQRFQQIRTHSSSGSGSDVQCSECLGSGDHPGEEQGPVRATLLFQDDAGSAILGHLQVSRVETRTDRQTLLFYSVQRCDPSGVCQVLEAGFGLIPNRDLVLSNGELKLQTNTREEANQEFQREVGSGGAIRLEWTPVSGSVTDFHSHSRTRVSRLVLTHSHVVGSLSSALAEGRVLGFAIDAGNSNALVGTQREGTISIFKPELVP